MKHLDYYLDVVQKSKKGGSGTGGITPAGTKTIDITQNGTTTHDVTQYATAKVNVSVPEPTGEKSIVTNGHHDVKSFASVNVNVPNQGITPSGVKTITENGTHDVTAFAQAKVDVPIPAEPTGEKVIDITQNGTSTEDVKSFASAKINVNVPVGVTQQGTKEIQITQNGETTEDVSSFKNVHIVTNVPSAGGGASQEKYDTLLSLFTGVGDVNINDDTITALTNNAFSQRQNLKSVILNNVTQCGYSTFDACSNLISVQMNRLKTIGNNTFVRCSKLEEVVLPELTRIAGGMFDRCTALRKVKCDKATSIDMNVFAQNSNLEVIDLLGGGTLSAFAYSTIPKLKAFVIRETSKLTQLSNAGYTGFNAGTKVYVPDALVEQYKTASNWSTHTDKIVPLSTYVEV